MFLFQKPKESMKRKIRKSIETRFQASKREPLHRKRKKEIKKEMYRPYIFILKKLSFKSPRQKEISKRGIVQQRGTDLQQQQLFTTGQLPFQTGSDEISFCNEMDLRSSRCDGIIEYSDCRS